MTEGLNEILFHLLWTKDKVFDSSLKAIIPSTVIFHYNQPRFWYFTASDGTIKRKSKEKLSEDHIRSEFLKKPSRSKIIATLLYIENTQRVIEYLTTSSFLSFLSREKTSKDMILQRFVDPVGDFNNTFSILWTTNFCLFEKKENKLSLYNEKYDLYERAVSFEGKDYHVNTTPLRSTVLPNRLLKTADSIVSHVAAVTFEKLKIIRMVVQTKLDKDNKIWTLCATSLRFLNDQVKLPVELNVDIQAAKDQNMKNLTVDSKNPAVFLKNCLCAFCLRNFEANKVIEMTYEAIYEKLKHPTPIYNLYPKVSHDDIKKLRKNKQFANKKTFACFDCYVEFTVLEEKNDKQLPLIGTGPLRPLKSKNAKGEVMTSTKSSDLGKLSSRNSAPLLFVNSPLTASHSYSMIQPLFSGRTSRTAGGELFLKIPKKNKD